MATPGETLNFVENHKCGKGALVVYKNIKTLRLGYQCNNCGEEAISSLSGFKTRRFKGASDEIVRLFNNFLSLQGLLDYYTSGCLKIWGKEIVENQS